MLYKETIVASAVQWTGHNFDEVLAILPEHSSVVGQESGRDRITGKPSIPRTTEVLIVSIPLRSQLWLRPSDWLVDANRLEVVPDNDFKRRFKPNSP
jgi:hypothetical protein